MRVPYHEERDITIEVCIRTIVNMMTYDDKANAPVEAFYRESRLRAIADRETIYLCYHAAKILFADSNT